MSKINDMRTLVNLHDSGLSDEEIATCMKNKTVAWVKEVRGFMELEENFQLHARQEAEEPLQFKSMVSHYEKTKEMNRKCLKCTRTFLSAGPQHRICKPCSKSGSFSLDERWVGASL